MYLNGISNRAALFPLLIGTRANNAFGLLRLS